MAISLRARLVVPVDRPPIEQGVVTFEGERILAVGTEAAASELDLGEVILLPGLVNAHTHLEFSYRERPLGHPGMSLVDWIRLVIAERSGAKHEGAQAVARGLAESIRHGVTTIGDIATAEVCSDESMLTVSLVEVIGFSRARAESAYGALLHRLEGLRAECRVGVSPHAPYTVSPHLLDRIVQLASDRELLIAMHLAESDEELELLARGTGAFQQLLEERSMWDVAAIPTGSRPLDYLRTLARAPRSLIVHGNYLDRQEREFLARHSERMSLVYCPRTHHYFRHSPYRLAELLELGVRVAIGTDSRASNPDLDLLAELRWIAANHPTIAPEDVLRLGTLSGAEALGLSQQVGSLTPGKRADMVALPIAGAAAPRAALEAMLHGTHKPSAVWLRGVRR